MSNMERSKGTLTPVLFDYPEEWAEKVALEMGEVTHEGYNTFLEMVTDAPGYYGFVFMNNTFYTVDYGYQGEDTDDYCNIVEYSDGRVEFDAYYYNGGCCWTEMVEEELKKTHT